MYRKSYALIKTQVLEDNIKEIKSKYPDYQYYIGVVKNDAYHHGIKSAQSLIKGGINYLAVSSLDEALEIRNINKDIPVLILEPIWIDQIPIALKNNITITVDSLEYTEELVKFELSKNLKVHLKLDTGMNRLGFKDKEELKKANDILFNTKNIILEGIYSHFATSGRGDIFYKRQLDKLKELLSVIDISKIPIRHFDRSITFVSHPKIEVANGIRLGIMMYGFSENVKENTNGIKNKLRKIKRNMALKKGLMSEYTIENDLNLKIAFTLYSSIISVRKVSVNETVGYNVDYTVKKDGYIATIAIGYADGVTKDFGYVAINSRKYEIVSDCMDMIMIFSETKREVGEIVEIFGDKIPVREVTRRLETNSYHLFNAISNRVERIYRKD